MSMFPATALNFDPQIEQAKIDERDALLLEAAMLDTVTDKPSADAAGKVLAQIISLQKAAEESRLTVTRPLDDAKRRVKAVVDAYVSSLMEERARLESRVAEWALAERKRIAEQEAAAREEARKAAAAVIATVRAGEIPQAGAVEAAREAQQNVKLVASQAKAEGVTVGESWDYEVTDVQALFAARPDLCVVEPSKSAIRAAVNCGLRECPGVRVFPVAKVKRSRA